MINKEQIFLIVGLGLMGGSYAEKLTEQGYKVYALNRHEEAITIGKQRKIILNQDEDRETLIKNADYIILGLIPSMCPVWVKENKHLLKKGAFITDMMGVKDGLVYEIQESLVDNEFISMHPMTGKELSGVTYSSSNIFNSSNMIIVPTENNTEKGKEFAYDLAHILCVKNINELSPLKHDEIVGYVSHLSHVISVCLMNCYSSEDLAKYAGTAFRDITRIANINENIWSELFIKNKNALIPLIEAYQKELEEMKELIQKGDEEKLKKVLVNSANRRKKLNS